MTVQSTEMFQPAMTHTLPPRTQGLPVVGALPMFARRPFDFLLEARARYGDIYTLDLGVLRWVILNHPRHTEHVLIHNVRNYRKSGPLWDSVRTLLGNGLVVSEGDVWLRQRRMLQPQFHRQRLAALADAMVTATAECLEAWEKAANTAQPLDVAQAFSTITMRVIARALFGQALNDQEMRQVSEAMAYVLDYIMVGSATQALPKWLPMPGAQRYAQMQQEIDAVVYKIIAHERNATTPSESMLAMLLQMVDEESGETMTDQQLHDEVLTFFLAGYETTSLALTWVLHFLTQHPDVMTKLQTEVDTVLQGRTPTFADLGALSYTRMVLQETMRIRPPSWWLPRTAVADDEIDGYAISAGTTVVSFTYGVHHNPTIWSDPERFDPERFRPERIAQQHKLAWAPFGAGQRQCIGRDFSIMEAQIILAMLVQRYTLTDKPRPLAQPQLSTTLRPKGGVTINVAKRVG